MIIVQDFSRSPVAREQRSPELWGRLRDGARAHGYRRLEDDPDG
jgi:hypothetical protein